MLKSPVRTVSKRYSGGTLESVSTLDSDGALDSNDNSAFPSRSRVIWQSEIGLFCELVSGIKSDINLYSNVLAVRMKTDPRWKDQTAPADNHSDHYCMFVNKQPVGCLGATRYLDGEIFMHEFCPPQFFDLFGDCLVSAFRFRILSEFRRGSSKATGLHLSKYLVREAWREQMLKGVRIDVINIEMTHVPLYKRMGYIFCDGSDYLDPILRTPSGIMFLPTDPDRPSIIQDLVQEVGIPLSLSEVENKLYRQSISVGKMIA